MTSDEFFEPMVPAPHEPPPAAQINHAEFGQARRCEVYRDPGGRPLLALAWFNNGQVLPLLFAQQGEWDEDGWHDDHGWWHDGTGSWRDGWGWHLLTPPAATAEPNRPRQPDQLERQVLALEVLDWENHFWLDAGVEEAPVGNTPTRL